MKAFLIILLFAICCQATRCASTVELQKLVKPRVDYAGCINFSPYVDSYDPANHHPPASIIDTLLDKIISDTPFRCIVSYGVLNGLNYTFQAAKTRQISVIAVLWLDGNIAEENQQSIQQGIENIRLYSDVIKAVACGVETRVRNSQEIAEQLITDCVTQLRAANIDKPIGTTDVWWSWVNQKYPYTQWTVANQLDWIGINIYPWWETKFDRNCLNHHTAPIFHIETLYLIQKLYPNIFVFLSEYGWPGSALTAEQAVLTDRTTGQVCGTATEESQTFTVNTTIQLLVKYEMGGIVFTSFREAWKDLKEPGGIASFWGICSGTAPYSCKNVWPSTMETDVYVPALSSGRPVPKSKSTSIPVQRSIDTGGPISPEASKSIVVPISGSSSMVKIAPFVLIVLALFTI